MHVPTTTRRSGGTLASPPTSLLLCAAASEAMTFLDHLDELRKRIVWAVASVAVAFAACWIFAGELYDIASAPIRMNPAVTLAVVRPQDIFSLSASSWHWASSSRFLR